MIGLLLFFSLLLLSRPLWVFFFWAIRARQEEQFLLLLYCTLGWVGGRGKDKQKSIFPIRVGGTSFKKQGNKKITTMAACLFHKQKASPKKPKAFSPINLLRKVKVARGQFFRKPACKLSTRRRRKKKLSLALNFIASPLNLNLCRGNGGRRLVRGGGGQPAAFPAASTPRRHPPPPRHRA